MAGAVPVATSLNDIYTPDAVPGQKRRWEHLLSKFESTFSHPAEFVSRSPGRVNIIGEHIDYSLYSVLPMAITADALIAVSCPPEEGTGTTFKLRIANVLDKKFPQREYDIPHEGVDIDSKVHEWTNYFKCGLKGAVQMLKKKHGAGYKPRSMNILMDGTVPAGGGLSSSAAFVSASALAAMVANGEENIDKTELTELAIVSERAVGVNSGGMDQSASVFSLRGSALYVSFVPSLTAKAISFPKTDPELSFVIAQSFVQSDKYVTGPVCYNLRVVECSLAAAYLQAALGGKSSLLPSDSGPLGISLRGFHSTYHKDSSLTLEEQLKDLLNVTKETLDREEGYTREEISKVLGISVNELKEKYESTFPVRAEKFKLRQRALHVFSEALRVLAFMSLLSSPPSDADLAYCEKLGSLMNDTQDSCRDLYECSCPEIDDICRIAREAGSLGSRLTGAGWGGCSVHLVPSEKVETVKKAWEDKYYSKRELSEEQRSGAVVVSKPGGGSSIFRVLGRSAV